MRMDTGLAVVHLFCRPTDQLDREAVLAATKHATEQGAQLVTAAVLGHKCDIAVMALSPELPVLRRLQTELQRAGLDVVDSYVSITEVSEYAKGMPEQMLQSRLYPQLPPDGLDTFCFYPMSKKREAHANWYATPYDRRNAMMREHGTSGRAFAGKVVQLVTGSTGLDDHEWGVTLFAASPEVVKDVVYTMRFDEGSALYGEFGRFYLGYLALIDDLV
ncbi:MAG: chlorite dismutase [Ilumatobacter sp.]|nr:MAG: chlorite dismutase [Ilumatobacter sp.]